MTEIRRRKTNQEQELPEQKINSYWHKIKGGEDNCYVCDKKIMGIKTWFVGYHKLTGEPLHRHSYCECGSVNWDKKFGGRISTLIRIKSKKKEESTIIIKRRIAK